MLEEEAYPASKLTIRGLKPASITLDFSLHRLQAKPQSEKV
jgi:hypothetical protein